jgi:hypothetical protein
MEEIDLKLKLFAGQPILAKGFGEIRPLKVKEIIKFGYSEYIKCLNLICLDVKDFMPDYNKDEVEDEIKVFDLILLLGEEELLKQFEKALSLFLHGKAIVDKDNVCVLIKRKNKTLKVNRDNYEAIQEVIKWQNYINHFSNKKEDDFKPADERARKLKEYFEKLNKKREEIKRKMGKKDDDENVEIDFYDIIDAISSKSNSTNEFDVLEMTVYQVYSKFKRLEIIDNYEVSIKSILAGAQNVKIKHWSSRS